MTSPPSSTPPSIQPIRSPRFYLAGECVIFQVENILYSIPDEMLVRRAPNLHRAYLSHFGGTEEGRRDACPVYLEGISLVDFEVFMTWLYGELEVPAEASQDYLDKLVTLMELSKVLDVPSARQHVKDILVNKLDNLPVSFAVHLGAQYRIVALIKAYLPILIRQPLYTLSLGDLENLGPPLIHAIMRTQLVADVTLQTMANQAVEFPDGVCPSESSPCQSGWLRLWRSVVCDSIQQILPKIPLSHVHDMLVHSPTSDICTSCLTILIEDVESDGTFDLEDSVLDQGVDDICTWLGFE